MSVLRQSRLDDVARLPESAGASLAWLGQAGFLIRLFGRTIVVGPYLSDGLTKKYRGKAFPHVRTMPAPIAPAALTGSIGSLHASIPSEQGKQE